MYICGHLVSHSEVLSPFWGVLVSTRKYYFILVVCCARGMRVLKTEQGYVRKRDNFGIFVTILAGLVYVPRCFALA